MSNFVGDVNSGYEFNHLYGFANSAQSHHSVLLGIGGISNTNGEIVLSNSYDSVKNSIFILTASTVANSVQTLLKTLSRSNQFGVIAMGESIQMPNNTMFSGTMDLTGVTSTGLVNIRKFVISFVCGGTGTITSKQFTELLDFRYNADNISTPVEFLTPTESNVYNIRITPSVPSKWTCIVEGIVTDI
jgi:hypothetical protein